MVGPILYDNYPSISVKFDVHMPGSCGLPATAVFDRAIGLSVCEGGHGGGEDEYSLLLAIISSGESSLIACPGLVANECHGACAKFVESITCLVHLDACTPDS